MREYASALGAAAGRPVTYRDLPPEEYAAALVEAGVPAPMADVLADSDLGIGRGELLEESGTLSRLLGRPATTMPEAVRAAVAALAEG